MSTFTAVNSTRSLEDAFLGRPHHDAAAAAAAAMSTTARPLTSSAGGEAANLEGRDDPSLRTPTRDHFGAHVAAGTGPSNAPDGALAGTDSQRSSYVEDGQDVAMEDSDDDAVASENEGAETEGGAGPPSKKKKKKKGQRFYCKDFPPCTLSFTRSEHLARHIRKHTGERPFQCHCSRRFSRLDNLRQHAQTVHVNEEIPTDSLAATGTRFQRQVRTDRVRPATGTAARSRASTVGSQLGHARGHSRNLSTSSIGSTASSVNYRDDGRPRPPPLAMATELAARQPLSLDTYRSPPDSPGGYSTPTSATFSTGPASPRFSASIRSPGGPMSPSATFWSGHTPTRRLSVPSGTRPVQSPMTNAYGQQPYVSALPSSTASTFSGQNSAFGSPTSSIFSIGHDSVAGHAPPDVGLKRRTWHPDTSRSTFTSPLANSSVAYAPRELPRPAPVPPVAPAPAPAPAPALGPTRLPGIESFDQISPRPSSPPRRGPSPMQVDSPSRPPVFPGPLERSAGGHHSRRSMAEWDMSLHKNLHRLGINNSTPPTEAHVAAWPAAADAASPSHQPVLDPRPVAPPMAHARPVDIGSVVHSSVEQAPPRPPVNPVSKPPETPRKNKRHGWYNGPIAAHRPSPDSSGSEGVATPSTSSVGEANPSIRNSNGWFDSDPAVPTLESQKLTAAPLREPVAYRGSPATDPSGPRVHPANGFAPGVDYSLASTVRSPPPLGVSAQPRQPAPAPAPPHRDGNMNMLRLEALVAVATSEDK